MSKYSEAITEAKILLEKQSRDVSHSLNHHKRVWKICKEIVKKESLSVDRKLLKIATFWHDVVVSEERWPSKLMVQDTCKHLEAELEKLQFTQKEITIIIDAVRHHEFRDKPKNVIGLILQDADKLDVLSEIRWNETLEGYKKGQISKEKIKSYISTFFKWVPILSATFHFKYSKSLANEKINDFWINEKWSHVSKELEVLNLYQKSKKEMSSVSSIAKRFIIRFLDTILVLYIRSIETIRF